MSPLRFPGETLLVALVVMILQTFGSMLLAQTCPSPSTCTGPLSVCGKWEAIPQCTYFGSCFSLSEQMA